MPPSYHYEKKLKKVMTEIPQGSILGSLLNIFTSFLFVLKLSMLINSVEHTKFVVVIKSEVCWDMLKKERIEVIEMGKKI